MSKQVSVLQELYCTYELNYKLKNGLKKKKKNKNKKEKQKKRYFNSCDLEFNLVTSIFDASVHILKVYVL